MDTPVIQAQEFVIALKMMTFLGIIFFFSPFLLIFISSNKALAFSRIFTFVVIFHILLALILQFFGIFNYWIVFIVNFFVFLFCFYRIISKRETLSPLFIAWPKILMLLGALLLIAFQFSSVHFNYSGKIDTVNGVKDVKSFSYSFPYFSDEWAGVSFVKYSIENKSLPIVNPLINEDEKNFPNIFVAFFSGLSEVFLLFDLDPLYGWVLMSIFLSVVFCFFVYLFLKSLGTGEVFSLFGALSLPLIVNASKLPGLWYLFPFIGGSIVLFNYFLASSLKQEKLLILNGALTIFIYPPFIVIILPSLLVHFITLKTTLKKKIKILTITFLLCLSAAALIFLVQLGSLDKLFKFLMDSLWHNNFGEGIYMRKVQDIVPLFILLLSPFGLFSAWKKKIYYFIVPFLVLSVYWVFYFFVKNYLIIDYARVAVLTSYVLVVLAALGLSYIFKDLLKISLQKNKLEYIIFCCLIVIFAFNALNYTEKNNWESIYMPHNDIYGSRKLKISPPANNHLNNEDLRLFKDLKHKRFLTYPWKGLVIGAATENYPLSSKASIISNRIFNLYFFMAYDCAGRREQALNKKIDYVYSEPFICDNFVEIGRSNLENLVLYEFRP
ncbi:hypothetical protein JXK06_02210 [Patescibacteria group bacterium]|nr:hypothetical protein [Patescibacteria group bacterium]